MPNILGLVAGNLIRHRIAKHKGEDNFDFDCPICFRHADLLTDGRVSLNLPAAPLIVRIINSRTMEEEGVLI